MTISDPSQTADLSPAEMAALRDMAITPPAVAYIWRQEAMERLAFRGLVQLDLDRSTPHMAAWALTPAGFEAQLGVPEHPSDERVRDAWREID